MPKDIKDLDKYLESKKSELIRNITRAVDETGNELWNQVIARAPLASGEYITSIKKDNVKKDENGYISVSVYTDLKSEPRVTDGASFLVGRMIEYGTGVYAMEPHIGITPTFKKSGYTYWWIPKADGSFQKGVAQPAQPHFQPALDYSSIVLKNNLRKAIKETFSK